MSDLFKPILRGLPGTIQAAGPVVVAGIIQDAPSNIAGLAPGTILKGTVIGREPNGTVSIATDRGAVRVATNATLPPGSSVTLEVRTAGDRLQVLILAVENAPVSRPSTQPSPSVTNAPTGQTTSGSGARPADAAAIRSGNAPAAGVPASTTQTQPQAEAPTIQVIGSSLTAIVVHKPADGSLLSSPPPTPDFVPGPDIAPGDVDLPLTPQAVAALETKLKAQLASLAEIEAAVVKQSDGIASGSKAPSGPGALQSEATAKIAALFTDAAAPTASVSGAATKPLASANSMQGSVSTIGLSPFAAAAVETAVTPLAIGSEVKLKILAVLTAPGQQLQIAPEAAHAANPLIGRIQGYTPAGHPIVQTPLGMLMLHQKSSLPVGAQVALGIEVAEPPAPVAIPIITTPQQAMLALSRGWPTLADLFDVVMRSGGASAAGLTQAGQATDPHLPQTGARLAAGLLNAIAALRAGDIDQLLGPLLGSRLLPADKQDVVKRLRQEFAQLSQLAQDRPGVDWRALFLPIYDPQYGLNQINLFYRHGSQGQQDEKDEKPSGTRFIVEATFTVLGAFQLDGLVRKKRFDLMIRCRKPISQRMRHEIMGIFDGARDLGGYAGALQFQIVNEFPVSPLEDLRKSASAVTA
jgi:hypothetical protein